MNRITNLLLLSALFLSSCIQPQPSAPQKPLVIASHSILAYIVDRVAGEHFQVESFVPDGVDSHSYQPTPQDVAKISQARVVVLNGFGFEPYMTDLLTEAGPDITMITATEGITPRFAEGHSLKGEQASNVNSEPDPHFWMDPILVKQSAFTISAALAQIDPENAVEYATNATVFGQELDELDRWIVESTNAIPESKRLIVTNHETLGYFADRYGFSLAGSVLEGSSSEAAASSQHLRELISLIKERGISVIFVEPTDDPSVAEQIAQEAGVRLETGLSTHSLVIGGKTAGYVEMMRRNVELLCGVAGG